MSEVLAGGVVIELPAGVTGQAPYRGSLAPVAQQIAVYDFTTGKQVLTVLGVQIEGALRLDGSSTAIEVNVALLADTTGAAYSPILEPPVDSTPTRFVTVRRQVMGFRVRDGAPLPTGIEGWPARQGVSRPTPDELRRVTSDGN